MTPKRPMKSLNARLLAMAKAGCERWTLWVDPNQPRTKRYLGAGYNGKTMMTGSHAPNPIAAIDSALKAWEGQKVE